MAISNDTGPSVIQLLAQIREQALDLESKLKRGAQDPERADDAFVPEPQHIDQVLAPTSQMPASNSGRVIPLRPGWPAPAAAVSPDADTSYHTAERLRAYAASLKPIDSVSGVEGYRNGNLLIERLAASAEGEDQPKMKLTPEQAADVLCFITFSTPISPRDWWKDPSDGPSHVVGFVFALEAVEECLRAEARS
jgi:hypothetical protein